MYVHDSIIAQASSYNHAFSVETSVLFPETLHPPLGRTDRACLLTSQTVSSIRTDSLFDLKSVYLDRLNIDIGLGIRQSLKTWAYE